jgi:hypothetical protein
MYVRSTKEVPMFRDDKQRALACAILCNRVRPDKGPLFQVEPYPEPTPLALQIFDGVEGASTSERLMVRAAFDFWNGSGDVTVGEALAVLDGDHIRRLTELMVAVVSSSAIDAWCAKWVGTRALDVARRHATEGGQ